MVCAPMGQLYCVLLCAQLHCVQKSEPPEDLAIPWVNFAELNIILPKDSHMCFKQWCDVSAEYTLALARN